MKRNVWQKAVAIVISAVVLVGSFGAATASASFAVALVTTDRVVLASDSRTWDVDCDCFGGDIARKVDIRDRWAFIMTGWPGVWTAWQAGPPRAGETAREVVHRLVGSVTPEAQPKTFTLGAIHFTDIHFGRQPDIYFAKVDVGKDGKLAIAQETSPSVPAAIGLGWDDGGDFSRQLLNRLHAQMLTRPSEAEMVAAARAVIATAASRSKKVGGAVHLAVLDATGSRWQNTPEATSQNRHWDGTNLSIVSGPLDINTNGIRIDPSTTGSYVTNNGFSFATSDGLTTGPLGVYATDSSSLRGISLQSLWSGGGAPTNQRTELLALNGTTRIGVSANIGSAGTVLTLESTIGGSVGSGVIDVVGVPNFRGATSGSAGAVAGYINIKVNGTDLRIPVHVP